MRAVACRARGVLAVGVGVTSLLGCTTSSQPTGDSTPDVATSALVAATTESVPTESTPTEPVVTAEPTVPVPEPTASCDPAAILPVVGSLFPENEMWVVVDVEVAQCRNGYARVFAIPDQSSCPESGTPCLETEQVFLRDEGGTWQFVDSGTGISCDQPDSLVPADAAACEALNAP